MTAGTTVFVTGAASGIGLGVARHLSGEGSTVVMADIDGDTLYREAADIPGAVPVVVDVADSRSVAKAMAVVTSIAAGLDGLVCAAGIDAPSPIGRLPLAEWERVLAVNLTGAFFCVDAALPLLVPAKGPVVLVGSPAATATWPQSTAYAASKGGLESFARAAAIDLASAGVRVNVVVPGSTDTPMLRVGLTGEPLDELMAQARAAVPLGRVAAPEEIARVVAFMLSDCAAYVTGSVWVVDGGLLARSATDV